MKSIVLGLVAPAFIFVFAAAADAGGLKRIKTEADFRAMIVGKKLSYLDGDGSVRIRKNGKLTGKFDGLKLVGAWVWKGNKFCRTVKLGNNPERSACQTVHASSDRVRFTAGSRVTNYSY